MKLILNSTDYSTELLDAIDKPIVVNLSAGDNTIEVKSEKPLSKIHWAIDSSHDGVLSLSYFNGTILSSCAIGSDSTEGLTESGWVSGTRPDDDAKDGDFYRYVFTLGSVTGTPKVTLRHAGIVFSEDRDLNQEYPNISGHLPEGDKDFLRFHVSAKDSIVQWFRGKGRFTFNGTDSKNLDEFDFLEPSELKMAAKFMTLAKIFFWLSDSSDDKYYQKAKDFMAEAYNSLDVYYISIDANANAVADDGEILTDTTLVIRRG